jgi:hypothetical protein
VIEVLAASHFLADTPTTWPDPPPMSTLHALLLFVGVPFGISVGIALLVLAPSLARGPRYRPSETWDADAEVFGESPEPTAVPAYAEAPQLTSGGDDAERPEADSGGASARW